MINEMKEAVAKPYWHVDAKWVSGICLFVLLTATLALFFLTKVTARDNAVGLSSLALATVFSRDEGLDGTTSINDLKKKVADQPGDQIHPIPEIPLLVISRHDLETLSPRELRLKIFRQLVEPVYDEGIEGAAQKFTNDPAAQQKLIHDASLLRFLTKSFHDKLATVFLVTLVLTVLLLAAFVYFSFGWGKLGNPGLLFFIVGLPGAFAGLLMSYPPKDGDGGPFRYIPPDVGTQLGDHLTWTYGVITAVGLLLIVIALIGSIVSRHRRKNPVKPA